MDAPRRASRRSARLSLALAALVLAALAWVATLPPALAGLAAGLLASTLGRPVHVEAARLAAGRELTLVLEHVAIGGAASAAGASAAAPGEAPPAPAAAGIRIARAEASFRWPRLLAGRLEPRRVRLEGLEGTWRPGAAPAMPPILPGDFVLAGGRLRIEVPALRPLELVDPMATLAPSFRPGGAEGTLVAGVVRDGRRLGTLAARLSRRGRTLRARVRLAGFELGEVAGDLPAGWRLARGRADGALELWADPDERGVEAELAIEGLELRHPKLRAPVAPRHAALHAALALGERGGTIEVRRLELDGLAAEGTLRWDAARRAEAEVTIEPFALGGPPERLQFLRLVGLRHASWARFDARLEAGRFGPIHAVLRGPLAELPRLLAWEAPPPEGAVAVDAAIADARYRPRPDAVPLENVAARLRVRDDRLEILGLRMEREGGPLPTVDVAVDGIHRLAHLAPEERRIPRGAGAPTPGLGPLLAALGAGASGDGPATRIRLDEAYVAYPAFVLPVREAGGWLVCPPAEVRVERARGIVGGAPARFEARWDARARRVRVELAYEKGAPPPPAPRPPERWVDARVALPVTRLGVFRIEGLAGRVVAEGTRVRLEDARGALEGGTLEARAEARLDLEGRAPYTVEGRFERADAAGIAARVGLGEGALTGEASGRFRGEGLLAPGRPALPASRFEIELEARGGELGRLPILLEAVRLASPAGWSALLGRRARYDRLEGRFVVDRGALRIERLALDGSELRVRMAGTIDLLDPARPAELRLALLLMGMVDRVIDRVPLLGSWVLGDDRSLVALYFRVHGPIRSPSVEPVPPRALAAAGDWADRWVLGSARTLLRGVLDAAGRVGAAALPAGAAEPAAAGAPASADETGDAEADGRTVSSGEARSGEARPAGARPPGAREEDGGPP